MYKFFIITVIVLFACVLTFSIVPEPPPIKETTKSFFCHFVTNAQAKVVKKEATGKILISNNGGIIRYKYQGIHYILTNARCQFGLASENVIIEN